MRTPPPQGLRRGRPRKGQPSLKLWRASCKKRKNGFREDDKDHEDGFE